MIDEKLITEEVLNNTLKREVFKEIRTVLPSKMGKVRTVYPVNNSELIMMASDNLSTHDRVHRRRVYGKGENLNAISSYYFEQTKHIVPNHFIRSLAPNTWLVQKAQPILVEMVFRNYITGSAWESYDKNNGFEQGVEFCGVNLREGYKKNEKLDEIIFTPTAKGQVKDFSIPEFQGKDPEKDDPPITIEMIRRNYSLFGLRRPGDLDILIEAGFNLYNFIHSDLESKGHLLADTKWEFGYLPNETIGLIDECVTPDSSRFWSKTHYAFNQVINEFVVVQDDKQHFRDYIEKLELHKSKDRILEHWMNSEVLKEGVIKYCNIREAITGTQAEITTEPRKKVTLEALAKEGYLI